MVRSFLGVPLLDRSGGVRGGLLLGHGEPDRFTEEDQIILVSLAGQAAVALENARLYHLARLRAQELQVLFDSIADGVTLVDRQGRIRRENAAASQVRRNVLETPEAGELLETLLYAPARAVLQDGGTQERVVQMSDARGERREYLVTAWPLRALTAPSEALSRDACPPSPGQGQFLSSAAVIWHDLAERRLREAAQAAQERTRYLEAIFAAMMDGVYACDEQGRIVQMNTAAQELLARIETPETAALPIQDHLANKSPTSAGGEGLTPQQLPLSRMLRGERYPSEKAVALQVLARDGNVLSLTVTGGPICDVHGQIIGAVLMARDVTEQQLAERLREEQAQQLRLQASLIALAHDAILVMDPHSRIVSWNRGAEPLYGWTAQEAQGQVTDTLLQTRFPVTQDSVTRLLHQEGW